MLLFLSLQFICQWVITFVIVKHKSDHAALLAMLFQQLSVHLNQFIFQAMIFKANRIWLLHNSLIPIYMRHWGPYCTGLLSIGCTQCFSSLESASAFHFDRNVLPQDFANESLFMHLSSLWLAQRGLPPAINLKELLFLEVRIISPYIIAVIYLSLSKMIAFKYLLTYWLAICLTSLRYSKPSNHV